MNIYAFHPGEFLAEEIEERGMTGADLARALNIPQNRVSEILNGKRSVSVDTALRLAQWIGSSPQYWLNLQQIYDLRIAEERIGEEIRRTVKREAAEVGTGSG
jgi:addiction module HigA family antidote